MCYNKTIENRTGESLKHESEEKKMKKYGNNDRYAIHIF